MTGLTHSPDKGLKSVPVQGFAKEWPAYHVAMDIQVFSTLSRIASQCLLTVSFLLLAGSAAAQPSHQDPAQIRQSAERFLRAQTAALPGEVSIEIGVPDPRLKLHACRNLHTFLPSGSRAWGKTTVGVRCNEANPWTIYVPAHVRIQGDYYIAAAPLAQGTTIDISHLAKARGELSGLPSGVITNPEQALGKTLILPVTAGLPLRQEILRSPPVIQQGQIVRIILNGPGFSVSNEGRALGNGAEGQLVQARTSQGQVVSGIAKTGGMLVVTY